METKLKQELRENIMHSSVWLKCELTNFLQQFDITPQQFSILQILRETNGEPLSTNEICSRMIEKSSDTSRIVDRLVNKKLARKQPCPNDGRKVQVFITGDGQYLLSTIDTKISVLDKTFQNLDAEEIEQLNSLLQKMRA